jgi:hypothetical protein
MWCCKLGAVFCQMSALLHASATGWEAQHRKSQQRCTPLWFHRWGCAWQQCPHWSWRIQFLSRWEWVYCLLFLTGFSATLQTMHQMCHVETQCGNFWGMLGHGLFEHQATMLGLLGIAGELCSESTRHGLLCIGLGLLGPWSIHPQCVTFHSWSVDSLQFWCGIAVQ